MRTIAKCILYFWVAVASVLLIQNLAITTFLSHTKDIPQFMKKEGVYAKIAAMANDAKSDDGEALPLPPISPELVEAIASPVLTSSLSFILGETNTAPTISLNKTLQEVARVDPGLVTQVNNYKLQAKELLTPDMINQLPLEQQKAALQAKDFLENDKTISLEKYLLSAKKTIRLIRLSLPVLAAMIVVLMLLTLLVSPTWKNKVTTLASFCFFLALTTGFFALFDSFVFQIALTAIDGTGIGEKFLQLLIPLVFTLSIRYFEGATIGLGALFLIFFLARLMLFRSQTPAPVPEKKLPAKKKK